MLLFLDIDGVMIPAKGWEMPDLLNDGFPMFSDKATRTLQSLISRGASIILTSSHKSRFSIEEWKKIFNNRGINIESIKSLPENSNNIGRIQEIVNWFNVNSVDEDFIILDDDKSLNALPSYFKERLVQTSPYVGLTEEHLEVINSILNKSLQSA